MNSFFFERASDVDGALRGIGEPGAQFIGGGTNLLDLMKGGVARPTRLVDITHLPLSRIERLPNGNLRIGALARNSDTANDPLVRRDYPLLSQALLAGASAQLRNMATAGGNLLQRTRCYYFYDLAYGQCNKRTPGSGCAAREGYNRIHAILGASDQCVAVHPSDMCVALAALDAIVQVQGPNGSRSIAFAKFHRLPGSTPEKDTNLGPGELIVAIDLPPSPFAQHSHYLKVRDRASFAFALVSVAAALEIEDGLVKSARIALGGVAHKPWRAAAAEAKLLGRPLDDTSVDAAAIGAVEGARPLQYNGFKLALTQKAVRRALVQAAAGIA